MNLAIADELISKGLSTLSGSPVAEATATSKLNSKGKTRLSSEPMRAEPLALVGKLTLAEYALVNTLLFVPLPVTDIPEPTVTPATSKLAPLIFTNECLSWEAGISTVFPLSTTIARL